MRIAAHGCPYLTRSFASHIIAQLVVQKSQFCIRELIVCLRSDAEYASQLKNLENLRDEGCSLVQK